MRKLTESPLTALGPDALGKALGRHSSSKNVVFSKNKTEKQVKFGNTRVSRSAKENTIFGSSKKIPSFFKEK
jgi:hypothetical protein